MSLNLYGIGASRSFRCLWALEESGLEFEFTALEFGSSEKNGTQSTDYLNLNPQGKVPTLIHDDFVLTESGAILNYIDSLTSKTLIPIDSRARARYDELAYFVLTELEQPLWTTGKHRFALPKEQRVAAVMETAAWEFDKALKALAKLNDLGEYALGDQFTFADILLAQTFNWADKFTFSLPQRYLDYRNRMYARAATERAQARIA